MTDSLTPGIILVHGYSGSADDLAPLGEALSEWFGPEAVRQVQLYRHEGSTIPPFTEDMALPIRHAMESFREQNRPVVVVGHSTGGTLALLALSEAHGRVDLLVLAAVPRRVDADYAARWRDHRRGQDEISFSSLASLIKAINRAGTRAISPPASVLILHGEEDELVPVAEATDWRINNFGKTARVVIIPGARHHLFRVPGADVAIDAIRRAIECLPHCTSGGKKEAELPLNEPGMREFLEASPASRQHLLECPSGLALRGLPISLGEKPATEPVFLNVEITTRCNLACAHCARTFQPVVVRDMTSEQFCTTLDLLPQAYRVTLVGLGEPLLHPNVAHMVAEAASRNRRVALATNGMLLDERMSMSLLDAGLDSIAFSIDVTDADMAEQLRKGTRMDRVLANIRRFTSLAKKDRTISTAVFTAVSTRSLPFLPALIEEVAGLGVHVMMLSDLNFRENAEFTLWKNADDESLALLRRSILRAFEKKLPVLSVRALEEFDLTARYNQFLLVPPDQLANRSSRRANCCSPWQTMVVGVDGHCDR